MNILWLATEGNKDCREKIFFFFSFAYTERNWNESIADGKDRNHLVEALKLNVVTGKINGPFFFFFVNTFIFFPSLFLLPFDFLAMHAIKCALGFVAHIHFV